jgi:catechol 2,3-dioxygenase
MRLSKLGHVLIRAADQEKSKRFYTEVLGFGVAEHLPNDAAFLTLGDDFHTFDVAQVGMNMPGGAGAGNQAGVGHIAFQVDSYAGLRDAYKGLQEHGIEIQRAVDHNSQRSIYFRDPDGLGLEIYYEVPNALKVFEDGRSDEDRPLPLSKPGEPLPEWLLEEWPKPRVAART